MNENLFSSFITPMMMGLPIVIWIIMFQQFYFPQQTDWLAIASSPSNND